jgi:SAM-dependent methyltransferase
MPVARAELAERRAELLAGAGDEVDLVAGARERLRPSPRRVLNATPLVVRTNLGRRTGTHRRWYRPAARHGAARHDGGVRGRLSRRIEMQWRDREGAEAAAIAAVVSLDGKRVLEVGCGTGRLTAFAAARAARVYAFDPDSDSVAKAADSLQGDVRDRVRFAVHDAEALDLRRRRFDLALCGWSL